MKKKLVVFLTLICIVALLLPLTVSAAEAGTVTEGLGYYEDGSQVFNNVIEYQEQYYAFDESGAMIVDQQFWLGDSSYRAKADGTLYVNEWYYAGEGSWFYYGEEGKAAEDFLQIDGTWYFFDYEGEMVKDQLVWSNDYQAYYILSADGEAHTRLNAGWVRAYGAWYYGETVDNAVVPVQGAVRKIGSSWYAFDYNGKMAVDEEIWIDGSWRRAKADGTLYVKQWYQDAWENWYFYGAEGKAPEDFYQVGADWYYFTWDGRMLADEIVWSSDYNAYYVLSEDGSAHKKLGKAGWNYAFGYWYYMVEQEGGLNYLWDQVITDTNGKQYYVDWSGRMVANEMRWISELGMYMYADADGVLKSNGWIENNGKWQYLKNGNLYSDGIYEIGGKLYAFDWDACLVTEPGEYNERYYIKAGGSGQLYRNTWRQCEILYPYEIGWVYYGNNGAMVQGEVVTIGSLQYGFDYNGVMLANTIREFDGVAYYFNAEGYCAALNAGWHQDPETQERVFVRDGSMLKDVITKVGSKVYGFSSEGYMLYNDYIYDVYNDVWGYYLFDESGALVSKKGWAQVGGEWFYVQEDGTLAEGWLSNGGNWYYCAPNMQHDVVFYDYEEQKCYVAGTNGVCVAVTGSGLQKVGYSSRVYLENNKAVKNAWRQVDGAWYYFDESGFACYAGTYTINGKLYLFDGYGKLMTGGWVTMWGEWYYADPKNDSALYTGLKTIGGTQYLFGSYGEMYSDGVYYYDGVGYLLANNGAVLLNTAKDGWKQVGNDWYYVQGGSLMTNGVIEVKGARYGFDQDGKMLSGGYKYCWGNMYVFAADGKIKTGWQRVDGQWVYAHPDWLYTVTWDWTINGKDYVFDDDGYLMIGSFVRYGTRYTTDADGAVVDSEDVSTDGWFLSDGSWYYTVDGEGYDGWYGDYYLEDGYMYHNSFVEYDGQYYYLTPNGKYLRNAWYETPNGTWILARADGSLYCSQWVYTGGAWYYFYGYSMVSDCHDMIDDEWHEFDEDGKWLGKVEYVYEDLQLGLSDGWHQIGGKWYYYYGGYPSFGDMLINGKRYYFDLDTGVMVTNTMEGDYGWYYFGADGAAVNHTGWAQLGGVWYYFNPDHTLYFGMIRDSVGLCYLYVDYDEDTEEYLCKMMKNEYCVIGNDLYYFDANGYTAGAITTTGWYLVEEDWYYVENGALVTGGYHEVNGVGYYFYFDGSMAAGEVCYVNGAYRYFDVNGKMVKTAGWNQNEDGEWVYVRDASGRVYYNGCYIINGVEYYFVRGILVE